MSVRVRFAPSPTGYLHIGGARTALYDYLYAKAKGGEFVLRIDDTDIDRSSGDFEKSQVADLAWLGIIHDEGPDKPKDCGPYRQSERLHIYDKYAKQLIDEKKAFYCFCTDEELSQKREAALANNQDPIYDGTCRHLSHEVVAQRIERGEKPSIRFIATNKEYRFTDHVRGEIVFPAGMVGDFVIIRSNGLPTYNYCCTVDDWLMRITHVIRAEEHLNNTVRQLMIYEAFNAPVPEFAHASLIIGKDRQKLSKRHGATSVTQYRESSYLPVAIKNYLCLLGWSHPHEQDIFDVEELKDIFDINRFNKAPATFDFDKFKFINGQHLRKQSIDQILEGAKAFISSESIFHTQTEAWKKAFVELYFEKVDFYTDFNSFVDELFREEIISGPALDEINSWETTPIIRQYLKEDLSRLEASGNMFATDADVSRWMEHIKKELKIKGKPLFMGVRGVLTGSDHGADLLKLVPLTPIKILRKRV